MALGKLGDLYCECENNVSNKVQNTYIVIKSINSQWKYRNICEDDNLFWIIMIKMDKKSFRIMHKFKNLII